MIPPRRRRTRCRVDSYESQSAKSCHLIAIDGPPVDRRSPMCPTNLLDVVVGEGAAILKLLASKDQALLIRRNALLVLDLGLDIVDSVRGLDLKGDGLARQGLHETGFVVSIRWIIFSCARRNRRSWVLTSALIKS